MSFEEEFPSLHPFYVYMHDRFPVHIVQEYHIRKYCLDKENTKETIIALEEEFWRIINENEDPGAYEKAIKIKNLLLKELKL